MAEYTKVFDNPYPEGWKDLPSEETPITASALQEHTDAIENIETYLEENPIGGGGTDVQWNQLTSSGIHIADITIDGETTEVFAPNGGGGGSSDKSVTRTTSPLTDSADGTINAITLKGNSYKDGDTIIIPSGDVVSQNADKTKSSTIHTDRPLLSVNDVRNELVIDKNGNGKFVKRVVSVDLGTLSWTTYPTKNNKNRYVSTDIQNSVKRPSSLSVIPNIISDKYNATTGNDPYNEVEGITIHTNGNLMIYDSVLNTVDASAFKVAMNGIRLVYESENSLTIELDASEVAELLRLKTFEGNTYIDTDGCPFEITYNVNETIGTLYDKTEDLQKQIDEIDTDGIYSTEETRIGTFLGKPLYRKIVSRENLALPSYSASSIDVNLTSDIGTNNIQIIKANITVNDSASGQWASVCCQIAHTIGTNSYKVKCLDSWGGASGRYVYFILEYTKTTD